jgi:hypothetical protein
MFFMTLTARLVTDQNSVCRNSPRIPALHRTHLAVHRIRLTNHYGEGREAQRKRHRNKRILFPKSVH